MREIEEVYFKVQAEFICDFIRQQYWLGNKPYKQAIKSLMDCFNGLTEETAKEILLGKKLLVGLYPDEEITLQDDDNHQEYLNNRRYIEINERVPEEKNISDYDEFLQAFKTEFPSYKCRFENHEMDNSTIDYRLPEFFKNLQAENYKLVGVCLNPELRRTILNEESIGLVIEDQKDFREFWFHGMDIGTYKLILEELEEIND